METKQDLLRQLKTWKAEGGLEIPRALLNLTGDMEAAAMLYIVLHGAATTSNRDGLFYLPDADFAARLGLGFEAFRHLRRKLESAGLFAHIIRKAGGLNVPHYLPDLDAILGEMERVAAGGLPRFTKGRHKTPQNSHLEENKRLNPARPEISHLGSNAGSNFHTSNETNDLTPPAPNFHTSKIHTSLTTPAYTPRGDAPAVSIWEEVMQIPLPPGGAELIKAGVREEEKSLAAWRFTLLGWKANPKWNNSNIDGQISRYTKKLRDGDFDASPVPENKPALPNPEEEATRTAAHKHLYGDQ